MILYKINVERQSYFRREAMEDNMAQIRLNTDSLKERKEWKRHKVNDGDNVFRILPPFGEASNGYPYHRWVIAWLADPNKETMKRAIHLTQVPTTFRLTAWKARGQLVGLISHVQ